MKVEYAQEFIDNYNKRFSDKPQIWKKLNKRVRLFERNPNNPILKDHPLKGGLEGFRAFSVTRDVRVIYYVKEDIAYFADIGTHEQVY